MGSTVYNGCLSPYRLWIPAERSSELVLSLQSLFTVSIRSWIIVESTVYEYIITLKVPLFMSKCETCQLYIYKNSRLDSCTGFMHQSKAGKCYLMFSLYTGSGLGMGQELGQLSSRCVATKWPCCCR